MNLSLPRKLILSSVIACGAVFALMTAPLAIMGDQQVRIRIEEESFLNGRLRDISPPYIVFATLISVGTGISVAALMGWKQSNRNSFNYQEKLGLLEKDLKLKEKLLEEFKFSDSRLQASGLDDYLPSQSIELLEAQKKEEVSNNS
ncbi:hypothetical protein NIES267_61760 [Calothrix parasitica NIES-267]|uniref:Uncharacterized protein n=1 Tax=Calothrix parasitica NIES-267 TaxID=1973488 RepID=A0A1Z4LZK5_9CYAN|nr:hypothetical protein NIES267_61760 [Calothrix parasitica NIES-267]